jgi:hypothetical protein
MDQQTSLEGKKGDHHQQATATTQQSTKKHKKQHVKRFSTILNEISYEGTVHGAALSPRMFNARASGKTSDLEAPPPVTDFHANNQDNNEENENENDDENDDENENENDDDDDDDDDEAQPLLPFTPKQPLQSPSFPIIAPSTTFCCEASGRVLLLFLASGMCFGSQVAYDSIGASAPVIRSTLGVASEGIGDLYSAYHLPNTVMVILGGIFADRVGLTAASIVFSLLICAGTTVVAFASPYSFKGMLVGRLIFGLGAESLNIVQISMLSKWFRNTNTFPSFACSMAVAYSISALGTVLAYDAVPTVAERDGLGIAMWSV